VFSRVAPRVVAPVRSPRRAVDRGGCSIVASAQQCPANWRATATTTIVRGLPRRSSACQRACRRRALRSRLRSHSERLACASALQRDAYATPVTGTGSPVPDAPAETRTPPASPVLTSTTRTTTTARIASPTSTPTTQKEFPDESEDSEARGDVYEHSRR